jgi:CubicO group peptidase (beta-lactamase class C family)
MDDHRIRRLDRPPAMLHSPIRRCSRHARKESKLARTARLSALAAIVVMLTVSSPLQARAPDGRTKRPEQRALRIENGLVGFAQGSSDSTRQEPVKRATLSERMAFYRIPGVSIAVIDGFRLDWVKGYGALKADGAAPVTPGSLFEAASTTKALVAATVLQLVDRGRLDLDADVNTYLKSWKIADSDLTREKKVTLRMLLTHQSGLPATNMGCDDGAPAPTLVKVLNGEPPARNKPAVVGAVPGERWEYSNIGYVVIQMLLEDVVGKPFPRIMDETVFQPLDMRSSTFAYPLTPKLRAREAWPHDEEGTTRDPVMHPTALAQGGLITTSSDLARFATQLMLAYQGRSSVLLSQAAVRKMFEPQVDLDPKLLGMPLAEGLGVLLHGQGEDLSFLHPGDNWPGASCWLVGLPELGKGAVIMTNGVKGNLLAMEILKAIADEYGWPHDP